MKRNKWDKNDMFAFRTQKLRAKTVPSKKRPTPTIDEWAYDVDNTNEPIKETK